MCHPDQCRLGGCAEGVLQWSEIYLLKPNVILSLTKDVVPSTAGRLQARPDGLIMTANPEY